MSAPWGMFHIRPGPTPDEWASPVNAFFMARQHAQQMEIERQRLALENQRQVLAEQAQHETSAGNMFARNTARMAEERAAATAQETERLKREEEQKKAMAAATGYATEGPGFNPDLIGPTLTGAGFTDVRRQAPPEIPPVPSLQNLPDQPGARSMRDALAEGNRGSALLAPDSKIHALVEGATGGTLPPRENLPVTSGDYLPPGVEGPKRPDQMFIAEPFGRQRPTQNFEERVIPDQRPPTEAEFAAFAAMPLEERTAWKAGLDQRIAAGTETNEDRQAKAWLNDPQFLAAVQRYEPEKAQAEAERQAAVAKATEMTEHPSWEATMPGGGRFVMNPFQAAQAEAEKRKEKAQQFEAMAARFATDPSRHGEAAEAARMTAEAYRRGAIAYNDPNAQTFFEKTFKELTEARLAEQKMTLDEKQKARQARATAGNKGEQLDERRRSGDRADQDRLDNAVNRWSTVMKIPANIAEGYVQRNALARVLESITSKNPMDQSAALWAFWRSSNGTGIYTDADRAFFETHVGNFFDRAGNLIEGQMTGLLDDKVRTNLINALKTRLDLKANFARAALKSFDSAITKRPTFANLGGDIDAHRSSIFGMLDLDVPPTGGKTKAPALGPRPKKGRGGAKPTPAAGKYKSIEDVAEAD